VLESMLRVTHLTRVGRGTPGARALQWNMHPKDSQLERLYLWPFLTPPESPYLGLNQLDCPTGLDCMWFSRALGPTGFTKALTRPLGLGCVFQQPKDDHRQSSIEMA